MSYMNPIDDSQRFVVLVEFVRSDPNGTGGLFQGLATRREFDFSEVEVTASTQSEAWLIAAQMVSCRPGIEVTRTFPSC